jgi:outer membrane immunogenic protein
MKLRAFVLVGAVALVGMSGLAAADGYRAYAPPITTNWSGFYVGAHLGGAWSDADQTYPITDHYVPAGSAVSYGMESWLAGGHIGLQHQFGRWVVGGEVSWSALDLKERITSPFASPSGGANPVHLTAEIDGLFLATARLGHSFDRALVYVKGGYASAKIQTRADDNLDHFSSDQERHHGWTIGTGVEFMLHRNIVLGVEDNFINLDSERYFGDVKGVGVGGQRFMSHTLDADIHTVGARLSYKFDRERDYRSLK